MSISAANMKKLEYLWSDDHKIEFIETFIKIADKNGKIVPFILTDEQRRFVTGLEHKNIVSKSRQLGLSVCAAALSLRECIVHENSCCILISHSQESTNKIFEKLKQQFYSLPEWIRPGLTANNRQALTFDNGSSITCTTAGNKDVGRGATINGVCHMSEYALWKNQESQLQSIMQAVTDSATVIIESTTKGFNKYSELYIQARNGENDFKPFFFNWINGRALFEKQYEQSVQVYKAQHGGKMLDPKDYDEEEKSLEKIGMTPEQAVWRRAKIAESSLDSFHEEFPSTFEESCLSTGSSIFNAQRVARAISTLVGDKIKPIPTENITDINAILRPYLKNKSLYVWKLPQVGARYWIGVDVSEGLAGKHDYSTVFVMDKDGEQVAQFRNNKIQPYEFADVVDAIGRWYNKGLLTVEKASGGHSVIERLRYEKHYMNMTKYKTYDEFSRMKWQVGFDTNAKTKSIAVNDAREWFDRGLIKINSRELLEEMKVFVADEKGSMNAISGNHDDLISALWLCIAGQKSTMYYSF